jgi:hypothetical protein
MVFKVHFSRVYRLHHNEFKNSFSRQQVMILLSISEQFLCEDGHGHIQLILCNLHKAL